MGVGYAELHIFIDESVWKSSSVIGLSLATQSPWRSNIYSMLHGMLLQSIQRSMVLGPCPPSTTCHRSSSDSGLRMPGWRKASHWFPGPFLAPAKRSSRSPVPPRGMRQMLKTRLAISNNVRTGERTRKVKTAPEGGGKPTLRIPRLTGVNAPLNGRLVLEHGPALERDPVATERAIAGVVFNGNEGGQQLEFLNEGAVEFRFEIGELVMEIW